MSKSTDIFNWQRFVRVFLNDLMLLQARRIGFASLGLIGVGIITYVTNATESPGDNMDLALTTFTMFLLGGGAIFTSMIFNDMHHPLERFQYLMLPCSNLERFVSRYLVTAPLFFVYAVVFFKVFEVVANFVIALLADAAPVPPLQIGSDPAQISILVFFIAHMFVFCGAIWFRSYSLIKTLATGMLAWTLCAILTFLAMRIFYWDSFISFFEMNPEGPFPNIELDFLSDDQGRPGTFAKLALALLLGWTLILAYLGLKEHEVQDGL